MKRRRGGESKKERKGRRKGGEKIEGKGGEAEPEGRGEVTMHMQELQSSQPSSP
jgi:hypothetical protein